jgi:hypothetical protein
MSHDEKARDYAARLKALLDEAREDGFVFAVSGGHRTAYNLTVMVLPRILELDELNQNQGD